MRRERLRELVARKFGARLERGSLDELEQFLAELEAELPGGGPGERLDLDDAPASYESGMREFFARALQAGDDEHFCQLWITALRLWVAAMQEQSA